MNTSPPHPQDGQPWWKFPLVWMVLAGPAVVVVAGIATAVIAHRGADVVLPPDYGQARMQEARKHLAPAVTGRNHAATPAKDHPQDR